VPLESNLVSSALFPTVEPEFREIQDKAEMKQPSGDRTKCKRSDNTRLHKKTKEKATVVNNFMHLHFDL
jgi:hypothetical protein